MFEGFTEALFFDANHFTDALFFLAQFRISVAHDLRDGFRDFVQKRFL